MGAQYYLSVTYNLALVLLFAVSLLSSCAPVLVAVVGRKEVINEGGWVGGTCYPSFAYNLDLFRSLFLCFSLHISSM